MNKLSHNFCHHGDIPQGDLYVLQSQMPYLAPLTYASKYVFKGETVSLDVHHNREKNYTDKNKPSHIDLWTAQLPQ